MVIYSAMLGAQFQGVLGHLITKSIMSVPASVLFAHMLLPDDSGNTQDLQQPPRISSSAMDSITRGTGDGLALYLNIIAILIVLTAFVALANSIVGFLPAVGGESLHPRAHRRLDLRAYRLADGHPLGGSDHRRLAARREERAQ
jgi:CNT family concentrative nucleoside transporter